MSGCKRNFCPRPAEKVKGVPVETMCIQWQVNRSKPYDGRDKKLYPDYGEGCRCKKDELTYPEGVQPKASSGSKLSAFRADSDSSQITSTGSSLDDTENEYLCAYATSSDTEVASLKESLKESSGSDSDFGSE